MTDKLITQAAPVAAQQGEPVAYWGDCGNAECGWRGPISDCSYSGAVGPCCPSCREIVEPSRAAPVAAVSVAREVRDYLAGWSDDDYDDDDMKASGSEQS